MTDQKKPNQRRTRSRRPKLNTQNHECIFRTVSTCVVEGCVDETCPPVKEFELPKFEPKSYVRKPVFVKAIQITTENFDAVVEWCGGTAETDETRLKSADGVMVHRFIKVDVKRPLYPRQMQGFVGDWLLHNDSGWRVYTESAFQRAFDLEEVFLPTSEAYEKKTSSE